MPGKYIRAIAFKVAALGQTFVWVTPGFMTSDASVACYGLNLPGFHLKFIHNPKLFPRLGLKPGGRPDEGFCANAIDRGIPLFALKIDLRNR